MELTVALPAAEQLEAKWLRCALSQPDRLRQDRWPPEVFVSLDHRHIYAALRTLQAADVPFDDLEQLLTVLEQRGCQRPTAIVALQGIMSSGGAAADYQQYVDQLQKRLPGGGARADESVVDSGEIDRGDVESGDVDGGDRPVENPFQTLTTAQLLAQQAPRQWLFPHVLAGREPTVIVGPSKTLKSSLAVDLCAALASGGKFLGEFAAERVFRTGFVSCAEQGRALTDLAERWQATRAAAPDLTNLMWSLTVDDPTDPDRLDQLSEWIVAQQLEVVVIDPLRLRSTNKRNQAAAIETLARRCLDAGATPIFCVSTPKERKPGKLDASILAGSLDFAQQWLLVNHRQTPQPCSGRHQLWLTIGGYAGQGGQWGVDVDEGRLTDAGGRKWEVTLQAAESLHGEADRLAEEPLHQRLRTQIRLAITALDGGMATKSRIRSSCGMNGAKFAQTWNRMFADGDLDAVPVDDKEPFPRYRLTDPIVVKKKEAVRSDRPTAAIASQAPPPTGAGEARAAEVRPAAEKKEAAVRSGSRAAEEKIRSGPVLSARPTPAATEIRANRPAERPVSQLSPGSPG